MGLRYSAMGYCTDCGETVAEMDGDDVEDFQADLEDRAKWAFERHVEDEHS